MMTKEDDMGLKMIRKIGEKWWFRHMLEGNLEDSGKACGRWCHIQ